MLKYRSQIFSGKNRYLLLFFPLLFLSHFMHAQRFEGKLIAGGNLAQIDGDRLLGYNKAGLTGGVGVTTVLSERWKFSLEFLYNQIGSRSTQNDDPNSVFDRIALNYIEVPVLIHFLDWKLHFNAGLTYSQLINYRVIENTGIDITDLTTYNNSNIAVTLGATYFKDEHWGFDFRWSRALNDLEANASNSSLINKWLTLRVIYVF